MRKGFTIVELMIVIVVISILIGIALPRFRGMQEEGNIAKAKGELRTLQAAVESYYIHYSNNYPVDGSLSNIEEASPSIVSSIPEDVFNAGNDYGYDLSANGNYYVIYSAGTSGTASATIDNDGEVTETDGNCIFISNGDEDSRP